jgi:hypothetical protein
VNSAANEPKNNGYRSVALGIALLGAVLAIAAACIAAFAFERHGMDGVLAAVLAAVVCWISASAALFITVQTTGGPQAVAGLFLSIAIRTFPPLLLGVASTAMHGRLSEAGLFGFIVILYLIALLVETCVAVKLASDRTRITR